MAQFNFSSSDAVDNFAGIDATGSGITKMSASDWTVADANAVDGKKFTVDILNSREPDPATVGLVNELGRTLTCYEIAIEDNNGGVRVEQLRFDTNINLPRIKTATTANNRQRIRIREVWKECFMFEISTGPSGRMPQPGNTVTHPATGSSGTVVEMRDGNWMILSNLVIGSFNGNPALFNTPQVGNKSIIVNDGVTDYANTQETFIQPPNNYADLMTPDKIHKSEWSDPVIIDLTTGPAKATIVPSKTTCLQGEAILFQCDVSGFDVELNTQYLDFEWSVAKAGEQAYPTYEPIVGSVLEAATGCNYRCFGTSRVWSFAPKTIGSDIVVRLDVYDRSGNHAFDEVTITSENPLTSFNVNDIYVVSDGPRAVPGDPGIPAGNFYSDFDNLIAALPATGEALILLDVNGNHGIAPKAEAYMKAKVSGRCFVMPYNSTGVGVDAGEKAVIDYRIAMASDVSGIYGVDCVGPWDPTNPYAHDGNASDGIDGGGSGSFSLVNCISTGWETDFAAPASPAIYMINESVIDEFRNYGCGQGDPGDHCWTGSVGKNNPLSWNKYGEKFNTSAPSFVGHTPMRASRRDGSQGVDTCIFMACAGHSKPAQPAVRLFGGAQHPARPTHWENFYIEQRPALDIGVTSASASNHDASQDFRWNRGIILCSDMPRSILGQSVGPAMMSNLHVAFRNNVGGLYIGASGASMFTLSKGSAAGMFFPKDTLNQDFIYEFNTAYSLIDPTQPNVASETRFMNFGKGLTREDFPNLQENNNLFYSALVPIAADNAVPPATGTLNMTPRFTPLIVDHREWEDTCGGLYTYGDATFAAEKLAWNLDPANGRIDARRSCDATQSYSLEPGPDSNCYQSAVGSFPRRDILGRLRPTDGTCSRGAYDPGGT